MSTLRVILGVACFVTFAASASPMTAAASAITFGQASPSSSTADSVWRLYHHGINRRYGGIVLPLRDGRVLVTSGGMTGGGQTALVAATEIFDPRDGTWAKADDIPVPGVGQSAAQLADGSVVVAGGQGLAPDPYTPAPVFGSSEILSPSAGTWILAGNLRVPRASAAMVVLANGNAMIIGGKGASSPTSAANPTGPVAPGGAAGAGGPQLVSVELFDPATRTWRPTGSLSSARSSAVATVLSDGTVLVMGGYGPIGADEASTLQPYEQELGQVTKGPILASELYDPSGGSWHSYHLSFPIGYDQQVVTSAYRGTSGLIIGMSTGLINATGIGTQPGVPAERYPFSLDVSTGDVSPGPADPDTLSTAPVRDTAIGVPAGVLADGRLVVAGAGNDYLYDPQSRGWAKIPPSPVSGGVGGSPPVVSTSGFVLLNVGDQWAVYNPAAVGGTRSSATGTGSTGLTWWLTAIVLALGLIAAAQFTVIKWVRARRVRAVRPDIRADK